MKTVINDVLGIGFGPSNLAVAIALREANFTGSTKYLEAQQNFAWQPSMLLPGSDIQHNPLRDLITPVNPLSPFGFVNYLHRSGHFFEYLNLGATFPLRREFADYVKWAADKFCSDVVYGTKVERLRIVERPGIGSLFEAITADGGCHLGRIALLGSGRSANIPDVFAGAIGPRVFHLNDYLPRIEQLERVGRVAVVGASQSAVEIMLDLDSRFPNAEVFALMRSFGYRLKDVSPFTGEVFFPEFTDYYHSSSRESRSQLAHELRATNYSAADADVINQLYLRRYESRLEGRYDHIVIVNNTRISACRLTNDRVVLDLQDRHCDDHRELAFDAVVLATGFLDHGTGGQRELAHPLLEELESHYRFNLEYGFDVARDYRLISDEAPPIYLNGLCESSHGFGDAGSFSLLSLRAAEIVRSLTEACSELATTESSLTKAPTLRAALG